VTPARTIAARGSPRFDTARFTRHLERAFDETHLIHLAGAAPRSFDVPPLRRAPVAGQHPRC
jgi:hypothetical protein